MPGWLSTFLGWGMTCAGLYLMARTVLDAWTAHFSSQWPAVPGTVVSSEVEADSGEDSADSWRPRVQYRYNVGPQSFTSNRVQFGDWMLWTSYREAARKKVKQYPPGNRITVRHHPRKPRISVLEPGLTATTLGAVGVGVFVTMFGAAILLGG